ncbi:MAG TPA: type II secretion system F family protein [Acidobacteriaceae bacterium]|jgi:tight adherence protein B|nr:type II secretion system F family protein [Acidobacteriaceae bacterium]
MILLIASSFFAVLIITFGVVTFATAPTRVDKHLQSRLAAITAEKVGGVTVSLESSELLRKTATSRFDWIGQTVSKYISMQSLQKWISQAAINTTASALFVQTAAAAGIGFVLTMFFAPILGVEFAVAGFFASFPWARVAFMRYRRLRAFEKALPHAIDMMARSLRAGHSTSAAIEIMAQGAPEPACTEFSEVFRQQNFGLPLRDALLQLIDRVPSADLRVLVTAICVQRETGGNLVEVLDRTVHVIRERQRIQGEIRTQTAQGRMTGWILTLLPVVVGALINFMDPGYSKPLFDEPIGHKLLLLCVCLIALGAFFINRIINAIEV